MSKTKTIFISIGILLLSAVITAVVFMTEPEAQRETATKKTAMLVDVVEATRGSYTPSVVATGNVQATKDIVLSPQVGGEVVSISRNFIPGSFVKQGEVLLQINPADYKNALQLRRSDLMLAKSNLSIEMGRQGVAQKDFELVGQEMTEANRALVLREPQLESAKASVTAAEAAVNQAELNLKRTVIRAPFDAHIITRSTNVGAQLAPGAEIGRLVGMEEYWVLADVPMNRINWLTFSEDASKTGSDVKIYSKNWQSGQHRKGRLSRLVGALDAQSRLARVLITISDPLARKSGMDTIPPLMIGAFVECHISARQVDDVVRLNRDHLRQGSTVWVMQDEKLQIRPVDIVFQDADYAYIANGITGGDQVVTTDLSTVVEGSMLRTETDTSATAKVNTAGR